MIFTMASRTIETRLHATYIYAMHIYMWVKFDFRFTIVNIELQYGF